MYHEEHNVFQEAFQSFVAEEITPNLDEWEEIRFVPKSLYEKMGENSFLCPWLPEEYGG
jgi:acyl-CoA dehydrogenase